MIAMQPGTPRLAALQSNGWAPMGETTFFSGRDEQVKFLGEVLRHGFSACVCYGQQPGMEG